MPDSNEPDVVPSAALTLAEFAVQTRRDGLPPLVSQHTTDHILDTVGVMLGAIHLETSDVIRRFVLDMGGNPQAHALGIDALASTSQAALVNGVLAHSLDFDDTHLPSVLHPSACVVPAGLACAETEGQDGAAAINAIAAGTEVSVRLGMAGFDAASKASVYFDYGQHATSICGVIGAAVTASLLLGLDVEETASAIGIAASMASGILEGNRTGGTVKRLHCGWAAQSGVIAAQLARLGMTGPRTAIEGRFGFLQAFLKDRAHEEVVTRGIGSTWESLNTVIKVYPANHFTHSIIETGLHLKDAVGDLASVRAIRIGVPEAVLRTIAEPIDVKRSPGSTYEAQFSGPYAFCVGLLTSHSGAIGLSAYQPTEFTDSRALQIMEKIEMYADSECSALFPYHFPAVAEIEFISGERTSARTMNTLGSLENPVSPERLHAKFLMNAEACAPQGEAFGLLEVLGRLENVSSISDLMERMNLLCTSPSESLNER